MRATTEELIEENRFKSFWVRNYQKLNKLIYRFQNYVGGLYEAYFTFYGALLFSIVAGSCLAFIDGLHGHCEGKIELDSAFGYFVVMIVVGFMAQTFLMVEMNISRLLRLLAVGLSGYYMAYQTYGYWSLRNIDSIASCKPYDFSYMTIIVPSLIVIFLCFFAGNLEFETESEPEIK